MNRVHRNTRLFISLIAVLNEKIYSKREPDRQAIWNGYEEMRMLDRKWGTPKSENEMGEGVKLMGGPGLIGLERPGDSQVKVSDLINIRKLYNLAFAVTMKTCFADLRIFARGNG